MKLINFFTKKNIIIIVILLMVFSLSLKSYTACGCGGCGGLKPIYKFTLNPEKIISDDEKLRNSDLCNYMGCSLCVKFIYFRFME